MNKKIILVGVVISILMSASLITVATASANNPVELPFVAVSHIGFNSYFVTIYPVTVESIYYLESNNTVRNYTLFNSVISFYVNITANTTLYLLAQSTNNTITATFLPVFNETFLYEPPTPQITVKRVSLDDYNVSVYSPVPRDNYSLWAQDAIFFGHYGPPQIIELNTTYYNFTLTPPYGLPNWQQNGYPVWYTYLLTVTKYKEIKPGWYEDNVVKNVVIVPTQAQVNYSYYNGTFHFTMEFFDANNMTATVFLGNEPIGNFQIEGNGSYNNSSPVKYTLNLTYDQYGIGNESASQPLFEVTYIGAVNGELYNGYASVTVNSVQNLYTNTIHLNNNTTNSSFVTIVFEWIIGGISIGVGAFVILGVLDQKRRNKKKGDEQ